ncbi:Gfo/Idh/MocA family oxidoreductase [Mycobacterium sp. 21AC1]|nr:Gfo/Idh/MocA family oxidoreductase [Mycobacterium sp. 21AC1]
MAGRLAEGLTTHTRSTIAAVASRDANRADTFAERWGVQRVHRDYAALLGDDSVEVVYVATPNTLHVEHALAAISAGKHVVVEKPLAMTEADGRRVLDAADARGVFAMEGMWTRFLPHSIALHDAVERGLLGEVDEVWAESGKAQFGSTLIPRLLDPELGGGALADLGVYTLTLAVHLLGAVTEICQVDVRSRSGVDSRVDASLVHERGHSTHVVSLDEDLPGDARVTGREGTIMVDGPFHRPARWRLRRLDGANESMDGRLSNGFEFEVAAVGRALAEGRLEHPLLTHRATLEVLAAADRIRAESLTGVVVGV